MIYERFYYNKGVNMEDKFIRLELDEFDDSDNHFIYVRRSHIMSFFIDNEDECFVETINEVYWISEKGFEHLVKELT